LSQSTTSILDDANGLILNQSTTSILDQSTTSILDGGTPVTSAYGHGTMIAGLIHLVAPFARLTPVKVFGNDGSANLANILAGIYWAVDHKADVINMSFSMTGFSPALDDALNYAVSQGVICVAAVGNEGQQLVVYPAGLTEVMGVGSTDNKNKRSVFSNYGTAATLAAPGEEVLSTYPGNRYAAGWGTSFSTALVSGGAALLAGVNPKINESLATQILNQSSTPLPGQSLGAGELNLGQAVNAARGIRY
jgi:subtilisin family serine protease